MASVWRKENVDGPARPRRVPVMVGWGTTLVIPWRMCHTSQAITAAHGAKRSRRTRGAAVRRKACDRGRSAAQRRHAHREPPPDGAFSVHATRWLCQHRSVLTARHRHRPLRVRSIQWRCGDSSLAHSGSDEPCVARLPLVARAGTALWPPRARPLRSRTWAPFQPEQAADRPLRPRGRRIVDLERCSLRSYPPGFARGSLI